ncbi:vacuolar acid trehalase isoform X3 [Carex rostrata]
MELSYFPRFLSSFSPLCFHRSGQVSFVPSPPSFSLPLCFISGLDTTSPFRASVAGFKRTHQRSHNQLGASSEGVPSELNEDSKFVPLDADESIFGPPVIHCTEEMIKQTLWDAIQTEQPNLAAVKIAKSLPRVCIFSGLSGEEIMMFIDAFAESGLESPVFAALVPNSADKILEEVIAEIMGDHEMLTGNRSE